MPHTIVTIANTVGLKSTNVNLIWTTGTMPRSFMRSYIVPILKPGKSGTLFSETKDNIIAITCFDVLDLHCYSLLLQLLLLVLPYFLQPFKFT